MRGAAGTAIALPLLDAMVPRRAIAAPTKRFAFMYFSNGVMQDTWFPTGTETSFTLPSSLEPLKPLQSKLVVLKGIDLSPSTRKSSGVGHKRGINCLLTARPNLNEFGNGISIDQAIAEGIGKGSPVASIQAGVMSNKKYTGTGHTYISYSGPQKPLPNEDNPQELFKRVFSTVRYPDGNAAPTTPGALDDRSVKRKSVLDFVSEDLRQLTPRVSASDRSRLEAHLTSLRDIERRLSIVTQVGASCKKLTVTNPSSGFNAFPDYPVIGKLQMDIIAMAFICEVSRVATLMWSTSQSDVQFSFIQVPSYHHIMSHNSDETSLGHLRKINNWYVQQLYYLAKTLDDVKEPTGGSILDNSVLLSGSEVAVGQTHSFQSIPFLLMGGANCGIKGNRFLTYPNAAHNDLFTSILAAMGLPSATPFGEPGLGKGPLPGLVG